MAKFPMALDDIPNPFPELEETIHQEENKRLRNDLNDALDHINALKKEVKEIKEAMRRQNAAIAAMIHQASSSSEG